MAIGFLELLVLLGVIFLLSRSRRLREKLLSLFRRVRGFVVRRPLLTSFLLGFLALILAESAFKPGHHFSTVMYNLVLIAAIGLFLWAMYRRFAPRLSGALLTECPTIGQLKEFLAERLPADERAKLAAHLEICTACQHRVEGLTAGQRSWPFLAQTE